MEFIALGSFAILVVAWLVAPSHKGEIVTIEEVKKAA
jgi:hypothetical protein